MSRPNSLAIIPARAGSKTIKDKNLIRLKGKTLVRIALEKALNSRLFSKVVITSDYPKQKLGIEGLRGTAFTQVVFHKRNKELCTDKALMSDVVSDTVERFGGGHPFVWLLQVTCPFTLVEDMEQIDKVMRENDGVNSLITFKEVKEHSNRTYSIKRKEGYLEAYKLRYTNFKNKQDLFDQFIRSGNIYVVRTPEFIKQKTLECKPISGYVVPRHIGVNIDDEEDLVLAKYFLNTGKVKGV